MSRVFLSLAANESMLGGAGVDGVIHRAAGPNLLDACYAHKVLRNNIRLPTGHSRILLSYGMTPTTTYIINTAGPRYDRSRADQCRELLTSCYQTSLALANLYDLESIAYPAISCGIFGYVSSNLVIGSRRSSTVFILIASRRRCRGGTADSCQRSGTNASDLLHSSRGSHLSSVDEGC